MLTEFNRHIKFGNSFSTIEIRGTSSAPQFQLLILTKDKDSFEIEFSKNYNFFDKLTEKISDQKHISFVLNNDKVLSKTIKKQLNLEQAVLTAFPNINLNDFYFEIIQLLNKTLVSIVRKEEIESLLSHFNKSTVKVIHMSLGNSVVSILTDFTNQDLKSSNAFITIENNSFNDIELIGSNQTTEEFDINGLTVSNHELLCFATILKVYLQEFNENTNLVSLNTNLYKSFSLSNYVFFGLKIVLGLLFLSLLINFLVLNKYSSENNILSLNDTVNKSYKETYLNLKSELDQKKKLANQILNGATSKTSFYFDCIGADCPKSISLTKLTFQPILKKVEQEKSIQLSDKKIEIEGTVLTEDDFPVWINQIEGYAWVKRVDVIQFGSIKKNTTFKIQITLF